MLAMAYGILNIKSFLNENFIEKDTKLKYEVNHFLNGGHT